MPTITSVPSIIKVSFLSLLCFKRTRIPRPPDVHNPAIKEPKLMVFFTNNIVSITDIAQFGIKPINETKNGWRGEFIKQYFAIISSEPVLDNINAKITEIININMKMFKVCFSG